MGLVLKLTYSIEIFGNFKLMGGTVIVSKNTSQILNNYRLIAGILFKVKYL
jgi:hypothetical protein